MRLYDVNDYKDLGFGVALKAHRFRLLHGLDRAFPDLVRSLISPRVIKRFLKYESLSSRYTTMFPPIERWYWECKFSESPTTFLLGDVRAEIHPPYWVRDDLPVTFKPFDERNAPEEDPCWGFLLALRDWAEALLPGQRYWLIPIGAEILSDIQPFGWGEDELESLVDMIQISAEAPLWVHFPKWISLEFESRGTPPASKKGHQKYWLKDAQREAQKSIQQHFDGLRRANDIAEELTRRKRNLEHYYWQALRLSGMSWNQILRRLQSEGQSVDLSTLQTAVKRTEEVNFVFKSSGKPTEQAG